MINRKKVIDGLLQNMYAMKHKLMVGYADKKELAITPSQGFVLRFVAKNSSANVKTIAETLRITSSAATQLIDGLVDKDYLVRKGDPDDRRVIALSLSMKAKKLFNDFQKQGLQKMTELFNALDDEELTQYVALTKKIMDNVINKKC